MKLLLEMIMQWTKSWCETCSVATVVGTDKTWCIFRARCDVKSSRFGLSWSFSGVRVWQELARVQSRLIRGCENEDDVVLNIVWQRCGISHLVLFDCAEVGRTSPEVAAVLPAGCATSSVLVGRAALDGGACEASPRVERSLVEEELEKRAAGLEAELRQLLERKAQLERENELLAAVVAPPELEDQLVQAEAVRTRLELEREKLLAESTQRRALQAEQDALRCSFQELQGAVQQLAKAAQVNAMADARHGLVHDRSRAEAAAAALRTKRARSAVGARSPGRLWRGRSLAPVTAVPPSACAGQAIHHGRLRAGNGAAPSAARAWAAEATAEEEEEAQELARTRAECQRLRAALQLARRKGEERRAGRHATLEASSDQIIRDEALALAAELADFTDASDAVRLPAPELTRSTETRVDNASGDNGAGVARMWCEESGKSAGAQAGDLYGDSSPSSPSAFPTMPAGAAAATVHSPPPLRSPLPATAGG
eukprot:TRINITY_DN1253_c0_g3_i2.p1 TRINITY_DN1253_c0_g3~~TRINITY_DN1253_c0_g3_i2.p1  ORF type:complete len:485 (-),score=106.52 TRINITY_DN1253_c0_g3_i2:107-1561(-)